MLGGYGNSVVIFLPGLLEVETMHDELQNLIRRLSAAASNAGPPLASLIELRMLHSWSQSDEFLVPITNGRTRIICACDLGDSTFTLPSVRTVVDLGQSVHV